MTLTSRACVVGPEGDTIAAGTPPAAPGGGGDGGHDHNESDYEDGDDEEHELHLTTRGFTTSTRDNGYFVRRSSWRQSGILNPTGFDFVPEWTDCTEPAAGRLRHRDGCQFDANANGVPMSARMEACQAMLTGPRRGPERPDATLSHYGRRTGDAGDGRSGWRSDVDLNDPDADAVGVRAAVPMPRRCEIQSRPVDSPARRRASASGGGTRLAEIQPSSR